MINNTVMALSQGDYSDEVLREALLLKDEAEIAERNAFLITELSREV